MFVMSGRVFSSTRCGWATSWQRLRTLAAGSTGALMVETIMAVTVMSMVAISALVGLSANQRARSIIEDQAIAETTVRNQMEYMLDLAYRPVGNPYPATSTPSGYTVTTSAKAVTNFETDTEIQKITVAVSKGDRHILVVDTFRAND